MAENKNETRTINEIIQQVLKEFLSYFGVRAKVDVKEEKNGYYANIKAKPYAGLLIGRRGANLKAFQHLVRLMVKKRLGYFVPLILDVSGYRMRRINFLKKKAVAVAKIVLETKKEMPLDQLNDKEIAIVSETLNQIAGIKFYTIKATGNKKNLIIAPQ
ncbi:MAG: KH domain-containing protein [candidate division WOR-3 bacterium]